MASKRAVEMFYDVLSPYAYVGFQIMRRYQPLWSIDLKLTPVLIGGIMHATDNKPPGYNVYKSKNMLRDMSRLCESYQLPYTFDPNIEEKLFKKGSLKAQRLLVATSVDAPKSLMDVSHALFLQSWGVAADITDDQVLLHACSEAGLDDTTAQQLLARTEDAVIKDLLKQNTAKAVEHGVFGLPAFVVDNKDMYFGSDRFELMAMRLGEPYYGALANPYQQDLQEFMSGKSKL
eukprot:m.10939 g.10939  ORF g.10939 m.10939 type:complete len:233 (+) comp9718_c0_seq1:32-730(+)